MCAAIRPSRAMAPSPRGRRTPKWTGGLLLVSCIGHPFWWGHSTALPRRAMSSNFIAPGFRSHQIGSLEERARPVNVVAEGEGPSRTPSASRSPPLMSTAHGPVVVANGILCWMCAAGAAVATSPVIQDSIAGVRGEYLIEGSGDQMSQVLQNAAELPFDWRYVVMRPSFVLFAGLGAWLLLQGRVADLRALLPCMGYIALTSVACWLLVVSGVLGH
mmetsp:Transcript_79561/g.221373  ORF Transcript_79561/g.221373 Transcript_79561/m.221373 type:complete len:217 (-) Transcript_79561:70-720(-)